MIDASLVSLGSVLVILAAANHVNVTPGVQCPVVLNVTLLAETASANALSLDTAATNVCLSTGP